MSLPFAVLEKTAVSDVARSGYGAIDVTFVSDLALTTCLIVAVAVVSNVPESVLLQSVVVFLIFSVGIALLRGSMAVRGGSSPADRVSLLRAGIAASFAGLVFHGDAASALSWWLPAVACVAVGLDGVDGWLARRTGTESAFGARLDIEADALLVLALSGLVWQLGTVGVWVLAIGLMRYVFAAAAMVMPLLRHPLEPSRRRQWVGVVQVAALMIGVVPTVASWAASGLAGVAMVALVWSFAVDVAALMLRADGELETSARLVH